MIRIGVVDDQPIIRQGIVSLIELSDRYCVDLQADCGIDALAHLKDTDLDLLITDIQMPQMDGIALIRQLRLQGNLLPVLVLTTFDEHQLMINAIKAGCNGFLLKDVSLEKLTEAIEVVASGGSLLAPHAMVAESENIPALVEPLSEKEIQMLRLAAAGFSNKEIAQNMFLAVGTVKNYLSRILDKTHSRDRTQAVVKAIHWGLI